ncbi:MAG: hypothetical protein IJU54_00690 [Alphaproteobacteria bacterium]|nr:hypothetical protein [Alphaproteobacteria bacterium]
MTKLLNIIQLLLLSNSFIFVYSTEPINTIDYNPMDDTNKQILNNCGIENNKDSKNFAKLFYPTSANDSNRKYLVYEEKYCYDLQTIIGAVKSYGSLLPGFNKMCGGNLIVKKCDDNNSNTYTLKQQNTNFEHGLLINLPANTTLIIPDGTTLDSEDVEFRLFNNSSLLLLGNLSNSKRVDNYPYLSFTTKTYNIYDLLGKRSNNQNIIIGPNATYDMVKGGAYSPLNISDYSNIILYPGCKINNCTIGYAGNLYLNRYTKQDNNTNKVKANISINMYTIYPENCNDDFETFTENNSKQSKQRLSYFPELYWLGNNHEFSEKEDYSKYRTEILKSPIIFDSNDKILKLDINDRFAKYDIKLSYECKVEDGKFSFMEYVNKADNINKYIDVNTIENLFINGRTYKTTGLLNNMPSIIYVGLIGCKDIKINTTSNIITLLGDNTKYTGKIIIPDTVDTMYISKNSLVNMLSTKFIKVLYYKDNNKV